jgi:hypothetical protein
MREGATRGARLASAVLFDPAPGGALARAYTGNTKSICTRGVCSLRRSVNFFLRRSVNFYVLRPAAVQCGDFAVWAIPARGVPAPPVFNRLFLSCLPVVALPGPLRPAAISQK